MHVCCVILEMVVRSTYDRMEFLQIPLMGYELFERNVWRLALSYLEPHMSDCLKIT